ncbi:MAG: pyrroline-5-carboxylate reductase [Firmicutes bacterium]|mgnify:CR=1 FL=1|nr:pyrroline-5-carboxylate reductase [Bacillota bacterium]
MSELVGIIGVGAMGGALLKGLLTSGLAPKKIMVADAAPGKLQQVADKYGVITGDVLEIARTVKIMFIAVKPQDIKNLLVQLAPLLQPGQLIVSVVAGVTISELEHNFTHEIGVVRAMPNTPCLIGEGAVAISVGSYVHKADLALVESWLQNLGAVHIVPEHYLDAVTGVSGSGPAYVYLLIESLADGGVLSGLPRALAQELAVQTVLGSALMVKETGLHPAILREQVTSPAGTTATAIFALENGNFRGLIQGAVKEAAKRSKELGKSE